MSLSEVVILLENYKYLFLFPIVVIEGPIITVIAGLLISLGRINMFISYPLIVFADVMGDSIYYAIGFYGRLGFIERWGRFFGITKERVVKIENHFTNHTGKTLITGKLTHFAGAVILVAAGVAKVPYWRFVWYNFLPTIPKSLALLLVGYYFGKAYQQIDSYFNEIGLVVFVILAAVLTVYILIKKFRK
jgi:membrane protein DedA with SNARE-associated domain